MRGRILHRIGGRVNFRRLAVNENVDSIIPGRRKSSAVLWLMLVRAVRTHVQKANPLTTSAHRGRKLTI